MTVAADPAIEPLRLEPPLGQARELAERHNLIALRHTYVEDCETPVSAFLKLRELAPGEWYQWSNVFDRAGLSGGEGYAVVTRTAGNAPWYAYGVLNDAATSDGSVISPAR